jgi:hypothetical protein
VFRVDTSPRHKNAKDPAGKRCEPFRKWLRTRKCILADAGDCRGKVRACHWDEAGDKGTSTKVSDKWSLPMCDEHHRIQTDVMGWPDFQKHYRFSPREVCGAFWRAWPGRIAWERDHGA